MTLRRGPSRPTTAVSVTPTEVCTLAATLGPEGRPCILSGARHDLGSSFPPDPRELAPRLGLMGRAARWSLTVPLPFCSALVHFPPVAAEELEEGARWQARKTFRATEEDTVFDFEVLGPGDPISATAGPSSASAAARPADALLVALPRDRAERWLGWLEGFPRPPRRLEPMFSAFLRALRLVAPSAEGDASARVFVYGAAGGSGAVILAGTRVLTVRVLWSRSPAEDAAHRWSGDEGIRILRETVLFCEDRHPWLEIAGLVPLGDLDPGWNDDAARALDLPLLPPPPPPPDLPDELLPRDAWYVPFGALLGG